MDNKKSHSATDEPWKLPGQSSQDPDHQHPINDVVEREAETKNAQWEKGDPKKIMIVWRERLRHRNADASDRSRTRCGSYRLPGVRQSGMLRVVSLSIYAAISLRGQPGTGCALAAEAN